MVHVEASVFYMHVQEFSMNLRYVSIANLLLRNMFILIVLNIRDRIFHVIHFSTNFWDIQLDQMVCI